MIDYYLLVCCTTTFLDLVDTNQKNGSHKVLANYFKPEQERRTVKHKQNQESKDICNNILKLKVYHTCHLELIFQYRRPEFQKIRITLERV
jgi:hypothetical protein